MRLYDAMTDPDVACFRCGHRLTKSNAWSSWQCIDCHEKEEDARGADRPALVEAMRRYNQPSVSRTAKAVTAAVVLLAVGAGIIHLRNNNGVTR